MPQHCCGDQEMTWEKQFSPFATRHPGIKLRLSVDSKNLMG